MKTISRLALALTACLAFPAMPGAAAPVPGTMSSRTEVNRRIITGAFARWSAGTGNFFDEVLASDVVWTIKGSGPSAGVFRGREIFSPGPSNPSPRGFRSLCARPACGSGPKAMT